MVEFRIGADEGAPVPALNTTLHCALTSENVNNKLAATKAYLKTQLLKFILKDLDDFKFPMTTGALLINDCEVEAKTASVFFLKLFIVLKDVCKDLSSSLELETDLLKNNRNCFLEETNKLRNVNLFNVFFFIVIVIRSIIVCVVAFSINTYKIRVSVPNFIKINGNKKYSLPLESIA